MIKILGSKFTRVGERNVRPYGKPWGIDVIQILWQELLRKGIYYIKSMFIVIWYHINL